MSFDHIINWELKAGSHEFPGPAGGTCINEAAIVAAGFEYKKVKSWKDCPRCFSPVLAQACIFVNDALADRDRPQLMPLVTRLSGSAGEDWEEVARIQFIQRSLDEAFVVKTEEALSRMSVHRPDRLSEARSALAEGRLPAEGGRYMDRAMPYLIGFFRLMEVVGSVGAARLYVPPLRSARYSLADNLIEDISIDYDMVTADRFPRKAAEIVTRAFEIGTRAPAIEAARVVDRMEAIKAEARARELA